MPKQPNQELSTLFDDFDLDAHLADKEEAKSGGDQKRIKLEEGTVRFRVLPARKGSSQHGKPWRKVWRHYVPIPGKDNSATFVCPRLEAKLPCRVCTRMKQMSASSNTVDQTRAEELKPKERWIVNVLDRAAPEDGPKIWEFGWMVYKQLSHIRDEDDGLGVNFSHPVTGTDIVVTRKGMKKNNTGYTAVLDPKGAGKPVFDDAVKLKQVLEQMHDLDAECRPLSDADILRVLEGEKPERRSAPIGRTADDVINGEVVQDDDEE
jgi:hypothetical protein